MTGLLISGLTHDVPGLPVTSPAIAGGPPYAKLDAGDYAMRPSSWVRQIVIHTTGGLWPQVVRAGAGQAGHAREIIDMWSGADRGGGDRVHAGSQLIVDLNGDVICLCDLVRDAAYHAEGSNFYSVGVEMCTLPGGDIFEATLDATARLVAALCWSGTRPGLLPIPFQIPRGPYRNAPLARCEVGSGSMRRQLAPPDLVGVIGHRDNTSERGFGDPGDAIWDRLRSLGAEEIDYASIEDQTLGRRRQTALNLRGARLGLTRRPLVVDGVVGPASIQTMSAQGFARWRDVA